MSVQVRLLLFIGMLAATLFGSAGRLDLPFVWAYLGVQVAVVVTALSVMDPNLVKERMRPAKGGKDRHVRALAAPFFLGHLVVAGLDIGRFHWSDTVPVGVQIAGLVGLAASFGLSAWTVKVNRFFSPVVRIQEERGHYLVTDGPYAWVRHPGYLAGMCSLPCGGLALGSWWSLLPLVGVVLLFLRRTALEDRFLRHNLEGYVEYVARVRYRLVPGLW